MEIEKKLYDAKKDEAFGKPFIDCREKRKRNLLDGTSISYHYLHGGFEDTNVKFVFCFPEKEMYIGRFYQHLSPFPGPDEEFAALDKEGEEDFIAFALSHGAAYVESNMGSSAIFGSENDNTIFYRSSAAVAEYCRQTAQELFGEHRTYGYVYGGSGGGYKTMSCIENTTAWDGAVPFVIGSPVSLPNCLTVCAHGSRLLRNCLDQIIEANEPGGDRDMYDGLTKEEADALQEITEMGFPPRMCSEFKTGDDGALPVLLPVVKMLDPEYFTDFWTKPGYLGTEQGGSALRDRICLRTTVISAGMPAKDMKNTDAERSYDDRNGTDTAWQKMLTNVGNTFIEVEEVPKGENLYLNGTMIIIESGVAKGKKLGLKAIEGNRLIPGMSYGADDFEAVIGMLKPGDEILLDNSDYIAVQTYHRHQVPEDTSFHAWNQYKDNQGNPVYPQRDYVISYGFTTGGCGSVQDGKIQGKVIVMNNLMDGDFPWQADWYRRKVEEVYGVEADNKFRLWYNDNCPHGDVNEGGDVLRVVSYLGMLRQALLDVADWAEKGVEPAKTSGYSIVNNQVLLDESVEQRCGIQPMVKLFAERSECARVKVGEEVHFLAEIQLPKAAGDFVKAEWSFEGEKQYADLNSRIDQTENDGYQCVQAEISHVFQNPGTYFSVVKVTSNRDAKDGYTQLRNLSRVRVIVEA